MALIHNLGWGVRNYEEADVMYSKFLLDTQGVMYISHVSIHVTTNKSTHSWNHNVYTLHHELNTTSIAPDKALFQTKIYFYNRIWPNFRTVHLGYSKTLGKLVAKYVLWVHFKKMISEWLIKWCFCNVFVCFFLSFFMKAYVVGTHLNCIDKSMQFKWVPTTYAFIKK